MNTLGRWIKANTTRKEFAKLMKTSRQVVARMCGKYGVPEKHIDTVYGITKIPRSELCGTESRGRAQPSGLRFDGAYWRDGDMR